MKKQEALSFSNPTKSTTSPITLTSQEDTLTNYLIEPQISSAPNSYQNDYNNSILYDGGGATSSGSNDPEYGFIRPDFKLERLVASVEYYQRHVFLCYKNPRNWPPRIEAAEFDRLPRLLSAALSARKPDLDKETRLTICEGRDGTETSNGDVLIFPDMIRYRRLTHFDVDTFVEEVLVKDGEWLPGNPEKLKGCYIFVCCHGTRDRRCGVCGPPLVAKFKEEVDIHGLQGKVSISPCSHVGGHKYAGNVIIFGSRANAEVTGHWYGYVSPDDVPNLFEQHVMKGEIVEWLWRGQMGLSEEGQQKAQELRLQNKEGNTAGRSRQLFPELGEINSPTYGSRTGGSNSCCQANGNAACCQNPTSAGKEEDMNFHGDGKSGSGRKGKKLLRHNSYNGFGKRKVCTMPSWLESWEHEDTYAALAVVCAAVSVGIAYSCYKRL